MYFVGIDISKYKHDCFICTETGEVIEENLSFTNTNEGFNQLLNLLKSLDNNQEIRIGFEATGHYGMNLSYSLKRIIILLWNLILLLLKDLFPHKP